MVNTLAANQEEIETLNIDISKQKKIEESSEKALKEWQQSREKLEEKVKAKEQKFEEINAEIKNHDRFRYFGDVFCIIRSS